MWRKLSENMVVWQLGGITEVYDERALRRVMRDFLSDESRARFGGENFSTEEHFLLGLEHLNKGLRLLLSAGD